MQSDSHARAQFLIDESRVAGIPPEDARWLSGHTRECPECSRYEEAAARIVRALGSFSFESGQILADRKTSALKRNTLAKNPGQILAGGARRWAWAAAALVILAGLPVYRIMRTSQQERADALLLERVASRVSRTVPAAFEPLVEPQAGELR